MTMQIPIQGLQWWRQCSSYGLNISTSSLQLSGAIWFISALVHLKRLIVITVQTWIQDQLKSFFSQRMKKLVEQCKKCIDLQEDCIEKLIWVIWSQLLVLKSMLPSLVDFPLYLITEHGKTESVVVQPLIQIGGLKTCCCCTTFDPPVKIVT